MADGGEVMTELKPCPLCGGQAEIGKYNTYIASFTRADKYYGRCSKNGLHSPQKYPPGFMTEQEAIEAWNRRIGNNAEF